MQLTIFLSCVDHAISKWLILRRMNFNFQSHLVKKKYHHSCPQPMSLFESISVSWTGWIFIQKRYHLRTGDHCANLGLTKQDCKLKVIFHNFNHLQITWSTKTRPELSHLQFGSQIIALQVWQITELIWSNFYFKHMGSLFTKLYIDFVKMVGCFGSCIISHCHST